MRTHVAGLAAALAVGSLTLVAVPPAYAVDNVCDSVDPTTPRGDTGRASVPYELLGMADAQQVAAAEGGGSVRVAVVSSGVVSPDGSIPVHDTISGGPGTEVSDPQGTVVAGLVAGHARQSGQPVGFAPGAQVVDVPVFVDRRSDVPRERPTTPALAAGLQRLAGQARHLGVRVAVVPFVVRDSAALRDAVRAVQHAGVVVVAASGDRPEDGSEFASDFEKPRAKDEDAASVFFPAGYPGVVAVNATGTGGPDDVLDRVVKNSRTTVAVPTYDAVSYGLNGDTCVVEPVTTAAAAAEVAGVLALLWQRYPGERPEQVVARLVNTANGTTDDRTPLTGAGVVQPAEALTRPLDPAADGAVERTVVRAADRTRAAAPEPDDDPLAAVRDRAVWWGLIGGGLLVVALLLRPVLARRRS